MKDTFNLWLLDHLSTHVVKPYMVWLKNRMGCNLINIIINSNDEIKICTAAKNYITLNKNIIRIDNLMILIIYKLTHVYSNERNYLRIKNWDKFFTWLHRVRPDTTTRFINTAHRIAEHFIDKGVPLSYNSIIRYLIEHSSDHPRIDLVIVGYALIFSTTDTDNDFLEKKQDVFTRWLRSVFSEPTSTRLRKLYFEYIKYYHAPIFKSPELFFQSILSPLDKLHSKHFLFKLLSLYTYYMVIESNYSHSVNSILKNRPIEFKKKDFSLWLEIECHYTCSYTEKIWKTLLSSLRIDSDSKYIRFESFSVLCGVAKIIFRKSKLSLHKSSISILVQYLVENKLSNTHEIGKASEDTIKNYSKWYIGNGHKIYNLKTRTKYLESIKHDLYQGRENLSSIEKLMCIVGLYTCPLFIEKYDLIHNNPLLKSIDSYCLYLLNRCSKEKALSRVSLNPNNINLIELEINNYEEIYTKYQELLQEKCKISKRSARTYTSFLRRCNDAFRSVFGKSLLSIENKTELALNRLLFIESDHKNAEIRPLILYVLLFAPYKIILK